MDKKDEKMGFEASDKEKYEFNGIEDSAVYAKESKESYLPGRYYLVSWKSYLEEKNTWEPVLVIQHLRKLLNIFHKDNPNKPIATFPRIDTAPPMAHSIVHPMAQLRSKQAK